jgi:hypothetical protein
VFFKCKLFPKCGTAWRTTHLTISHVRFQSYGVQVLWSLHPRLCTPASLSVIRGLPVAAQLWSSCWTVFVETGSSRRRYSYVVTCAAVVPWFFEATLLNVRQSLSVYTDFHPLLLFADVVFPWFVYTDIALETVALDTPNNVSVSVTDSPAKWAPMICPLSKSDKSPNFQFFHMDCHST